MAGKLGTDVTNGGTDGMERGTDVTNGGTDGMERGTDGMDGDARPDGWGRPTGRIGGARRGRRGGATGPAMSTTILCASPAVLPPSVVDADVLVSSLRPRRSAAIAAADLGFGALLFLQVSPALGLLIALAGLLILGSLVHELVSRNERWLRSAEGRNRSVRSKL